MDRYPQYLIYGKWVDSEQPVNFDTERKNEGQRCLAVERRKHDRRMASKDRRKHHRRLDTDDHREKD